MELIFQKQMLSFSGKIDNNLVRIRWLNQS